MSESPVSPEPSGGHDGFAPTLIGQMPPPLLLNRYQVVRLLGRGASGEVLEVRDLSSDISYAFKRVSSELSRNPAQFQALQSNFALISQLAHPHIATTRFFERDPQTGDVCLLMDLVRGRSLAEYLSNYRAQQGDPEAPLPIPVALGIAEQIAVALDYAHAQPSTWNPDGSPKRYGVLHRDLKPMNVMLESAREYRPGIPFVRLVDFGLAAEIQASLTSLSIATPQNNEICGTPGYMAPEQWEGRTLTRGVDQWALAVLIHEMVAGRPPFRAPSQMALMEQIRRAQPEKPPTLTDAQWSALSKTFTVDRKNRYPSCVALVRAVAQADPRTMGAVQVLEQALPAEHPTTGMPAVTPTGMPVAAPTGMPAAAPAAVPATQTISMPPPTAVLPAPSRGHGLVLGIAAFLFLVLAGGGVAGYLWFQGQQGSGLQRAVGEVERVSISGDEDEVAAALARLEKAEREFPYASDAARVPLLTTRDRLLSRREALAEKKRVAEQAREAEKKRQADYVAAMDGVRRILQANDPDRLEEADAELVKAGSFADTPERQQQVAELRKQIAQQLKERKDLVAVLLFTKGLESPSKTETDRTTVIKALLSRYRILPMERLYAAAAELKRTDLEHLSNEDLCRIAAKAGARQVVKVSLAPGGKGGETVAVSGELIALDKGVVQHAVLEAKDLAGFPEQIPLLVRILHMTDDEKEAYFAARRKREEERAAELARIERERQEAEQRRKELEEQRLWAEQEQKRLAEEKRKAEAAAQAERQLRLEQERQAKLDAARREAEKQAAEAAAAKEREQRLEQERAAQLALEKASGTAHIRRVWVEYNQVFNDVKGMMIHANFEVKWRKEIPGHVAAFFYWENGEKAIVETKDGGPNLANDGQVAVWETYTPPYDGSEWTDYKLFMPYTRFSPGKYKFKVQIQTNNDQTLLSESEFLSFEITQ